MDNYLSLLGRGLAKRKKFISQGEIGYAVSEAALQERETSASHPAGNFPYGMLSQTLTTAFFPFPRGGFKPELSNCLIV